MNQITFRSASREDLSTIALLLNEITVSNHPGSVKLLEHRTLTDQTRALDALLREKNNDFILAIADQEIVGCFQISFVPDVFLGHPRAIVENVRVRGSIRRKGIGKHLMEYAISLAKKNNCALLQLTTNSWRQDAIEFYKSVGFEETHVGLRIGL